jgi:hypothetical protein
LVNDEHDAQIIFYVFISVYNSLHVSSTSCSSSGETNDINTASGNSHSMLVAEMCAGWNQPAHIALNNGLQAIGIFFYLTKAYDVLNQKVLLNKLHY